MNRTAVLSDVRRRWRLNRQWWRPAGWTDVLAVLPFGLLVVLFLLAPLGWVMVHAFRDAEGGWSLANLAAVWHNAFYRQALGLSLQISLYSSVIGLVIGLQGAASLYTVRDTRLGRALVALNSLLSNFSGVPLAFAMMIVLGNSGVLTLLLQSAGWQQYLPDAYAYSGILISYVYFQIPLAVLLLYPAMESLKPEWRENAALLGASTLRYRLQIALPVLAPALLGTLVVLFANALGAYATAYALSNGSFNILPVRIATLVAGNLTLEPEMAAALSLVLVALMLVMTCVHQLLLRRYRSGA